jgi:hypothetical protein
MLNEAVQNGIDTAQLTQTIREQIRRMPNLAIAPEGNECLRIRDMEGTIERLRSIERELESLHSRFKSGEPQDSTASLRRQIGRWVKRRLYRLLWWQTHQLKALSGLVLGQVRETLHVLQALTEIGLRQNSEFREMNEFLDECRRKMQDQEIRLQKLELAQLRLQAAQAEWNTKNIVKLEAAVESLRREVTRELARPTESTRLYE